MAASEVAPYAKTGGLADVLGSLPAALQTLGVDARVVLPHYSQIDVARHPIRVVGRTTFSFGGSSQPLELQQFEDSKGFTVYLLEAPRWFRRRQLYDERDDLLRFAFFNRAVLQVPQMLGWRPDVIHCHDWQTGLLPVYLQQSSDPLLQGVRSIFTIHNLAYQGLAAKEFWPQLDLPDTLFNSRELEFYDKISPMKGGLVFSDRVTTVSPSYAREIMTPQFGQGLQGVLAARNEEITGILNGLDIAIWNPSYDPHIAANYSEHYMVGKAVCKRKLLQRAGFLNADEREPLIGMVSRVVPQKGIELVIDGLEQMLRLGCRLVLLGRGDSRYEQQLQALGERFAERVSFHSEHFDDELAHAIYAGSDIFLMPSCYEPCGLGQLIALAYGTIPVVRATGGLADTICDFDQNREDCVGFIFNEYSTAAMLTAVERAVVCYHSRRWPQLVKNAMKADFSWQASAHEYKKFYERVVYRL
jgi:starch synthase